MRLLAHYVRNRARHRALYLSFVNFSFFGDEGDTLAQAGLSERAEQTMAKLALVNSLDDWAFTEWLHGRTYERCGMRGQSWNAAAFLIARHAVASQRPLFATRSRRPQQRQSSPSPSTKAR